MISEKNEVVNGMEKEGIIEQIKKPPKMCEKKKKKKNKKKKMKNMNMCVERHIKQQQKKSVTHEETISLHPATKN